MRNVWFWSVAGLATLLTTTILLPLGLLCPFSRPTMAMIRAWGRVLLFAAGVRMERTGSPPGPGPYLIVCNHTSMLDIPACLALLRLNFRFVSRPFFFQVPFMGWGMRLTGQVSLDPTRPREAARVLREECGALFRRGLSLLLFPEGTRSRDGTVGRYRRGPFVAAIEHRAPVLPVRIEGLHAILPAGSLRVRGGRVRAVVGDPIPVEGRSARELADRIEAWTRSA